MEWQKKTPLNTSYVGGIIMYTNFPDNMAYVNSADPDQTDQGLHCLPFQQEFSKTNAQKQNLDKKV